MKKIYLLLSLLCFGFVLTGWGQTYTASLTGNWSNNLIWGVNSKPSSPCNNCTITLVSGITVTLDTHIELEGSSVIIIGDGSNANPTKLVVAKSSSATDVENGNSIVLDTLPGFSTIVLSSANSTIDGSSGGTYDGIFTSPYPPSHLYYQKLVGNAPSNFIGSNGNIPTGSAPPSYGQTLSGPGALFAGGTLPIILSSFTGSMVNNAVNLNWTTATEVNFSHFVLQRSGDQSTWVSIGTIEGKNAPNGANYSYTDQTPLHGKNYYRLQSIDLDGNSMLSNIILIQGSSLQGILLGPNPSKDLIGITFGSEANTNVEIRLVDLNGRVVFEKQLSNIAGSTVMIPVKGYAAGFYSLNIKATDGSQNTYKVVVSH